MLVYLVDELAVQLEDYTLKKRVQVPRDERKKKKKKLLGELSDAKKFQRGMYCFLTSG